MLLLELSALPQTWTVISVFALPQEAATHHLKVTNKATDRANKTVIWILNDVRTSRPLRTRNKARGEIRLQKRESLEAAP
jgi:hypothetical protein